MNATAPTKPAATPPADDGPALLTCSQAAKLLGVSRTAYYHLRAEGKIPKPVALLAGHPRWRRTDLLRFVEKLRPFTGARRTKRPAKLDKEQSVAETVAM